MSGEPLLLVLCAVDSECADSSSSSEGGGGGARVFLTGVTLFDLSQVEERRVDLGGMLKNCVLEMKIGMYEKQ